MSLRPYGGKVTVGITAKSLTTLLTDAGVSVEQNFFGDLSIQSDPANTVVIWKGGSNVTPTANQCGYIVPGGAYSQSLAPGALSLDSVYLVASAAGQVVYLDLVEY